MNANISRSVPMPVNISNSRVDTFTSLAPDQAAKPQVAVFITHGMGQQVQFETIDSVVEGLRKAAERHGNPAIDKIQARMVQIEGLKTQRAEFEMRDAQNREIEVHVYEGYWAPITEGQVSLRDVMSFLFSAGRHGIWNSILPFKRWIFGEPVSFGRQFGATLRLFVTLGVLLSLVVLNLFTLVVTGDRFITQPGNAQTFSPSIFEALTSTVGGYVAICLIFGAALSLLMLTKKYIRSPRKNIAWQAATLSVRLMTWIWVAATIVSAAILVLLALKCVPPEKVSSASISAFWEVIWAGLLFATWLVRKILVQYMGDVAAYIDSHSLDRFNDIRSRIKAKVLEPAHAVYSNPRYERIALVGHSLGSVVTYDTLNALINHDQLNGNQLNVVKRTRLLLTFGSPLDKTAFVFATQIRDTTDTRGALAATMQPMIQAYLPYRDIKWINIYSPLDIVSGKLEFYDSPDAKDYTRQRAVSNIIDEDALIPLAAHTEYWSNTTLFDQLYENL